MYKIIISNYSLKEYKLKKVDTGADYFLDKSFNMNELQMLLNKIHKQKGSLKDEE